jgi:hypothetical protein
MTDGPADDTIEGMMEECLDEIDEFMGTLQRFPDTVIATSMRVHLAALLRAMVESEGCTDDEVRGFVAALEQEALSPGDT